MSNLLNIYFTAGYPNLEDTPDILLNLQDAGADIIELGLPYSDPLADGPTIQASGQQALDNGMNLQLLFDQLEKIKDQISKPIYLMGYYNQWLQIGLEAFAKKCQAVGVYGLIIPDLPLEYFGQKHMAILSRYNLKISFLVTPQTTEERMRRADELSTGFVYVVSSAATTGKQKALSSGQIEYFNRIKQFGFKNKTLIGFGIHDKNTFETACAYADGAIIGSAFVRQLAEDKSKQGIEGFVKKILPAGKANTKD